ncbi:class I SAM-dependent methyltransferase [Longimicrobium sp.]|uniref:class I SAM-dependent methyltransferase n=1 Tax=Longimicrobium sp. TaxID=2029185 RepID=UPI003B3B4A34
MTTMWDNVYLTRPDWAGDCGSGFLLDLVPEFTGSGKRILDVGCGTGRNTLLFASGGTHIDCIDVSRVALDRLQRRVAGSDCTVTTYCTDIRAHNLPDAVYDLIICHGFINSLPKTDWQSLARTFRRSLKEGGVLEIAAFTNDSPDETPSETIVALADPAEMISLFANLQVERRDGRVFKHSHSPSGEHTHSIERFIFRKRSSPSAFPVSAPYEPAIAVFGPTSPIYAARALGVDPSYHVNAARDIGHFLADNQMTFVGVPDKGLPRECFYAMLERDSAASAVVLAPRLVLDGCLISQPWVADLCDRFPNATLQLVEDITWPEQVVHISQRANACVVLGLSCGGIAEIGWTKWTKTPVFASRDLCSSLPAEVTDQLSYFDTPDYQSLISKLRAHVVHKYIKMG